MIPRVTSVKDRCQMMHSVIVTCLPPDQTVRIPILHIYIILSEL